MKIIPLVQIALMAAALSACSTVKQINTDFKDFHNTILYYNLPAYSNERQGWHITCDYCVPEQKCKWYKCPNKN